MLWALPVGVDCYHQQFPAGWPMQQVPLLQTSFDMLVSADQDFSYLATSATGWHSVPQGPAVSMNESVAFPANEGQKLKRQKKQRHRKGQPLEIQSQTLVDGSDELSSGPHLPDVDQEDSDAQGQIQALADRLLENLRSGNAACVQVAISDFRRMTFEEKIPSRAAQLALETSSAADQGVLTSGLHGQVRTAMQSKHGNYVITKAVEVMPVGRTSFIVDELLGHGCEVARHRFGCRLICRILEHLSPSDVISKKLLDEVVDEAESLCTHAFGSIVIRHFLEHGLAEHRSRIATALRKDLVTCALQRKGSHVVEAAFRYCSPEACSSLAEQITGNCDDLLAIATGQFGRHVVVALLRMEGDVGKMVTDALLPCAKELLASKFGKTTLEALQANVSSDDALSTSKL
jgi:hypothetical protein